MKPGILKRFVRSLPWREEYGLSVEIPTITIVETSVDIVVSHKGRERAPITMHPGDTLTLKGTEDGTEDAILITIRSIRSS